MKSAFGPAIRSKRKGFADEHGAVFVEAEDAVRVANVVVTSTSSQVPVLQGEWAKEDGHINAFRMYITSWGELDDEVISQCTAIACSRNACM